MSALIDHGTISGYRKELRLGMTTCPPCRAANAARSRDYYRRLLGDPQPVQPCGTRAGYKRHQRDGTLHLAAACGCRQANTDYIRNRFRNAR